MRTAGTPPIYRRRSFRRLNGVLEQWCEEVGRDPTQIRRAVNLAFNLGVDEVEVKRQHRQLASDWGGMAERVSGGALLCTPDLAVERLAEYRDAGVDEINIAPCGRLGKKRLWTPT